MEILVGKIYDSGYAIEIPGLGVFPAKQSDMHHPFETIKLTSKEMCKLIQLLIDEIAKNDFTK